MLLAVERGIGHCPPPFPTRKHIQRSRGKVSSPLLGVETQETEGHNRQRSAVGQMFHSHSQFLDNFLASGAVGMTRGIAFSSRPHHRRPEYRLPQRAWTAVAHIRAQAAHFDMVAAVMLKKCCCDLSPLMTRRTMHRIRLLFRCGTAAFADRTRVLVLPLEIGGFATFRVPNKKCSGDTDCHRNAGAEFP